MQPVDNLIAVWKQLTASNDFVDNMEPLAFWSLKYQSTGWCVCVSCCKHVFGKCALTALVSVQPLVNPMQDSN